MNDNYHLFTGSIVKILSCSTCNIRCKHCYISYEGDFSREKLLEVVSALKDKHEVRINGTEVLLHKEYLDAIKMAGQRMVLTNGLVFANNYEYIDEIKTYGIKTIGISYHFDFHDEVSIVKKAYLDKLFKEIISRGLDVQIMTTLSSTNYDKILEYCKHCVDNHIRKIRFTNFMLQGNATSLEENLILDDDQRNKVFNLVDEARSLYPKEVLRIQRCGSLGNDKLSNKVFDCGGGYDSVVITPNLKAYPCLFYAKPQYEIGYYDNGNIYIANDFVPNKSECSALLNLNYVRRMKK